ncbi:ninein-like protein [Engraulis encrasicolus]|uniref:ninein-like protein n=1 Tax=Engraulis encrasicolus TaxID=184585 RepID=UPI002FD4044A
MDEEEQNRYVAQLKEEFDSCDTTGTGYLDKEELTALCHKLHLDAHLPLLLDTLLGPEHYGRVNFEEFKEGFVAVLSRSLDFSTSEEESSYLEPVIQEEVKPKFVKGTKRYGRKSRPDRPNSDLIAECGEDTTEAPFGTDLEDNTGVRRAKLRRSTSLESVESLKSDEETGSNKEAFLSSFEAQGQQKRWKAGSSDTGSGHVSPVPREEVTDGQVRAVWAELGVGAAGSLNRQELSLVCEHIGLKNLQTEELDALFRKLDKDQDGRVSLQEFQLGLFNRGQLSSPQCSSTPLRPKQSLLKAFEERAARSASPSLLSATVGQKLLSRLDDGSGSTSPERVITLWTEEGIRNSRHILQTLDFSLEERLSLVELTLALDNELLVSGNGIHQAALISYKNEIHYLQMLADQACRERDKAKADLEWADRRNLQLVREVDDRHATMESLNESKIKDLEQDFREKLTAMRSQTEQEGEVLLQQLEGERSRLQEEVQALQARDATRLEEVSQTAQENVRLEEEVSGLKGRLAEAEGTVTRLQRDLEHLLQDKFGGLDQGQSGLAHQEERFSEIIKEYEVQCRELRDRNDELSSEVEMLRTQQGSVRKSRRSRDSPSLSPSHSWATRRELTTEYDSDDPEMKKAGSPQAKKKLQVDDKNVLGSLERLTPSVSIETELAMEQLKEKYEQEVQDLKIQLETQVNFYERSMELMRNNMEVERKDISQSFKVEISELEEQKVLAEERATKLKQALDKMEAQLQQQGSGAWGSDQERRLQRERAELEQNFAREMGNIVQRLTSEKDQLELELKLKMDQEVLLVREEAEVQLAQCKQQYGEAQRSLLHKLHCERQHWDAQLQEAQQEARKERLRHEERLGEEQASICHQVALEKKRIEEEHREEVVALEEKVKELKTRLEMESRAKAEAQIYHQMTLEKRRMEEKHREEVVALEERRLEVRRLEDQHQQEVVVLQEEVRDLQTRLELECRAEVEARELQKRLEAKLEEMCEQLEDNTVHLKSQDAAIQRLTSELLQAEDELDGERRRAEEQLRKLAQLTQELESAQAEADALRSQKDLLQGNCNHLSSAFALQDAQCRERDEEMSTLRASMEKAQDASRSKESALAKQAAELEALTAERDEVREELKRQTTALWHLKASSESLNKDLKQMSKCKQSLQEALRSEQSMASELRSALEQEKEDVVCLEQENAVYRRMTNQLSAQIVEMEAETDEMREELKRLTQEVGKRDRGVWEQRAQLEAGGDVGRARGVWERRAQLEARDAELLGGGVVQQKKHLFEKGKSLRAAELEELRGVLQDKEKELSTVRQEAEEVVNQLKASLEKSQEELRSMLEDKDKELSIARQKAEENAHQLRASLQKSQQELRILQEEKENELSVVGEEVERLTNQLQKSQEDLEAMDRDKETQLSSLRQELEEAYSQLQASQGGDKDAELSAFRQEVEATTSKLKRSQREVRVLLELTEKELCAVREEARGVTSQLQAALEKSQEDLRGLRAEKDKELRMAREEVERVTNQLQRLQEVLATLHRDKETEIDAFSQELGEVALELQRSQEDLRVLQEDKEEELVVVRQELETVTNQLLVTQEELMRVNAAFEREKSRMREQLMEMEGLVLALEMVMDPASPHRAKLDEVHSENGALRDRLTMLQQDVTSLEDDVDRKRRRLDELEREHEKKREEEEQLHKENAKYREEVLDLSSRNLALSSENAELSSRLRSDQGAVQMLTERLAQVCREQEAEKASARQQQEEAGQQQRERAQLQASWTMEKELLERELSTAKEKIQQLSEVESELSSLTLKQQWLQQDKERLLKEAEDNNHKVEKLQESLRAVDVQAEQLRSQLQAASQERHAHGQEVTSLQRTLQESQDKVSELEVSMAALCREKEDLQRARRQHEDQATRALEEECQRLLTHNQSLLHKVSQLQAQEREMQKLTQECLTLKHKQTQLETATMEANDKALRADTALSLAQAQHTRAVHEMREQAGSREQMAPIQAQLAEQQRRGQQLEEMLRSQAQKASAQLALQQEQYEKVMGHMQERMEEVEAKLKSVRLMLQEKVNQLKEQLTKNAKSDLLLKDLYVENSQLMKALQITEQRQKSAEKKSFLLEEKVAALNKLLRKMAPVSLSA